MQHSRHLSRVCCANLCHGLEQNPTNSGVCIGHALVQFVLSLFPQMTRLSYRVPPQLAAVAALYICGCSLSCLNPQPDEPCNNSDDENVQPSGGDQNAPNSKPTAEEGTGGRASTSKPGTQIIGQGGATAKATTSQPNTERGGAPGGSNGEASGEGGRASMGGASGVGTPPSGGQAQQTYPQGKGGSTGKATSTKPASTSAGGSSSGTRTDAGGSANQAGAAPVGGSSARGGRSGTGGHTSTSAQAGAAGVAKAIRH